MKLGTTPPQWQRLDLPDADIRSLMPCPLPADMDADMLLASLLREVAWCAQSITLLGRTLLQPRLIAWVGDCDARYRYCGLQLQPTPWSALLMRLRQHIESLCQSAVLDPSKTPRFNSVLLNCYRNGWDHMSLHSDDEPELGPNPVIASLSLGATRQFFMRHKTRSDAARAQFPLAHGQLLLMQGSTQRCWKHGIRKLSGARAATVASRVNLTFRTILTNAP